MPLPPLSTLDPRRFETVPIFRLLVEANRRLAELTRTRAAKGGAGSGVQARPARILLPALKASA